MEEDGSQLTIELTVCERRASGETDADVDVEVGDIDVRSGKEQ